MGNVPDADGVLLVNDRQEWALVVYAEVENTMLVGEDERGTKDGGILGNGDGREIEAVEWGEHAEFELESIVLGEVVGLP